MLVGKTVRPDAVELCALLIRKISPELHWLIGRGQRAINALCSVGGQVMGASAGTLIGVDNGTSLFQSPFAGRTYGAIDATGAGRRRRHHAGAIGIKAIRHLDHDRHQHIGTRNRHVGDVFVALNEPFTADAHLGAKEGAIPSAGRGIHQCTVVVIDRQPAEFRRGRVQGICECRRGRTGQTAGTKAGGQQVIIHPVVTGLGYVALDKIRDLVEGRVILAGSEGHPRGADEGAEHYSFHDRSLFVVVNEQTRPQARPRERHADPVPTSYPSDLYTFNPSFGCASNNCSGFPDSLLPIDEHERL